MGVNRIVAHTMVKHIMKKDMTVVRENVLMRKHKSA